jgi:hypothetical protein
MKAKSQKKVKQKKQSKKYLKAEFAGTVCQKQTGINLK